MWGNTKNTPEPISTSEIRVWIHIQIDLLQQDLAVLLYLEDNIYYHTLLLGAVASSDWARSQPMREEVIFVKPSFICSDLVWPYLEKKRLGAPLPAMDMYSLHIVSWGQLFHGATQCVWYQLSPLFQRFHSILQILNLYSHEYNVLIDNAIFACRWVAALYRIFCRR